ncbi:maleylpyruvate isomerase family mycothiol-dependent enzyme [Mycobacterium sp. AMU20-3851]|uniref:maleylpyruvate isomerase family mycothiol-dependent enzyme n=1 Tax=Mycobacterium sp. AMU20-3851 TaxID=3122055 RepID=UPI00375490CD
MSWLVLRVPDHRTAAPGRGTSGVRSVVAVACPGSSPTFCSRGGVRGIRVRHRLQVVASRLVVQDWRRLGLARDSVTRRPGQGGYPARVGTRRPDRERVFVAVADGRRAIAALIEGLDADQLATPSLCSGWDVKTVAAHLVSDFEDGFWGFVASGIRHRSMDRGIDALASHRADAPATEIADALRQGADHRLSPPVTGPLAGLTDVLVHAADIRIPLGIPHTADPEHVAWVLDFLTSRRQLDFFPRARLRGISLIDEVTGRTWGEGAPLVGPGESLMLAACGRAVAFEQLSGRPCRCFEDGSSDLGSLYRSVTRQDDHTIAVCGVRGRRPTGIPRRPGVGTPAV